MAFTLPWTVNKLVSTNINNADSITGGVYGNVSLKVGGKSQLVGATVIEGNVGIGTAPTSNKLEVNGTISCTALNNNGNTSFSNGTIQLINTDVSGNRNIQLNVVSTSSTILNYNFATPAQSQYNFTGYSPPYTAITNWTISTISGTAYSVFVGNDFTSLVNNFALTYPDAPLFNQYLSFQGTPVVSMQISQNRTFAVGSYLLSFYGWGEYNRYSTTMTLGASCGTGSITNLALVEQAWTKITMKFTITSAGSYPLIITMSNSSAIDSGCSISGITVVSASGMIVCDSGNVNNQLITPQGLYTNGEILNRGKIYNFGPFKNYGALELYLPFSSGSLVLGSAAYGSNNATVSKGKYNVFIGQSIAVASNNLDLCNFEGLIAIGYAALEQINGLMSRNIGIGYQAGRYNTNDSLTPDCVSIGYQANQAIGYGGTNSPRNVSLGSYVLSGAYVSSADNTIIGHASMSGVSFSNGRSFNSVLGSSSLIGCLSNHNSSIGYNNAPNMINTASNNNTFVGSQVCATQSGSGNALLNCTFLGSTSNVSAAGNWSNSTAVGYGSIINANNRIILGRNTEQTYTMGGLVVPSGGITASATQTITFGTNAPTMSGANISATSIPNTALQTSVLLTTGAQSISGLKTFTGGITASGTQTITFGSNAPTMSGANISTGTIKPTSVANLFSDLSYNYGFGDFVFYGKTATVNLCSAFGSNAVGGNSFGGAGGTSGISNSGFGANSLLNIENGGFNSACGTASLNGIKSGSFNSSVGSRTAYSTDGSNNIFIGFNSGTDAFNANIINNDCTLVGQNTYAPDGSVFRTVIGSDATADIAFVGDNSIVLGRENTDDTYVMNNLYLKGNINIVSTSNIVYSTQLDWLSSVNTASNLNISNPKVIIGTSQLSNINTSGTTTLNIGNATSTTKVDGPLIVSNNSQKVNGYSTLSGTPNNLAKPLSEYYTLSTSLTGALTLPVIDADMYGSQLTFTKISAANTWTVNAGSGNTFRLFKSNSTATATSIAMAGNFTVLRIVASQSTVWDVIQGDPNVISNPNDVILGTNYIPYDVSGGNAGNLVALDLSANTSYPIYNFYTVGITVNTTWILPIIATDPRVFEGMEITFRRIAGTTTTTLTLQRGGTQDLIAPLNAVMGTATSSVVLASGVFIGRVRCIVKPASGIGYWAIY